MLLNGHSSLGLNHSAFAFLSFRYNLSIAFLDVHDSFNHIFYLPDVKRCKATLLDVLTFSNPLLQLLGCIDELRL